MTALLSKGSRLPCHLAGQFFFLNRPVPHPQPSGAILGFSHTLSQAPLSGLLAKGIKRGDRIGVMAGNCEQYVSLFFAAARVGAILVVINNTYTCPELMYALKHVGCKLLFIVPRIGRHSLLDALSNLKTPLGRSNDLPELQQTIMIRGRYRDFEIYDDVKYAGRSVPMNAVQRRQEELSPSDVCNLQFTSGSTGNPKAAMLSH
ncbi:acyl-CoA synthetase [Coccidioides immitis H538.4]|uniref:Acyl-CoA synthetase n=1 Tax=Coccidioides immitis H538.4 TaxID=396776 RepID=A0A0J8S891_COCIT|nr:acyl-CoA synthetase [Coccidioides immitis H538.4]